MIHFILVVFIFIDITSFLRPLNPILSYLHFMLSSEPQIKQSRANMVGSIPENSLSIDRPEVNHIGRIVLPTLAEGKQINVFAAI